MTNERSSTRPRRPLGALKNPLRGAVLGIALVGVSAPAVVAQGIPVIDATAIVRWGQQLQQMQAQLDQARSIYDEAQHLGDSFNQITDVSSLGGLLNDRQFQQLLPPEYSRTAGAVNGLLQGNIDGFAQQYDYYQNEGGNAANSFYQQEVQRRKGETYQDMAVGKVVYNQASQRLDGLNQLRDRLSSATTPKEVMDLQARLQAESTILQNEVLRMQGLAMIQEARNRVDDQRLEERSQMRRDGIRSALEAGR
ncbi:type IV secretion system protein [Aureimonas altamirensis]|uniref:type IV secretion system protein n=1 Tax=Aureimonas altamirensis TaxID=370622 RepID=UPI0020375600|nr:type IV secretion system protein [Aureimonas altamirensis]MCM2505659.1 type IV secretion system protein [Aureimonas altamirensis]